MSSIKPLEHIIKDEKALRLLEMVGEYFQYAEKARTKLDDLTIILKDIILEPYTCEGRFNADYELVSKLDSVALGTGTKEGLVEFIKNCQDKQG
ncbi:hypothetical protein MH215_28340 [Paenibacillus sp. ACRSA]|uniref:hypothetical protein n=1 Tax=Paenibacillus sp. ACRSA TaxID=2918211 RepID=UPI001EF7109C|nr:hypothetical protein [Paenibacillus sp. ACRSA]MCG7380895.1 hypothetical protein [Paenibacillus sp. ACRSA]